MWEFTAGHLTLFGEVSEGFQGKEPLSPYEKNEENLLDIKEGLVLQAKGTSTKAQEHSTNSRNKSLSLRKPNSFCLCRLYLSKLVILEIKTEILYSFNLKVTVNTFMLA